MAQFARPDNDDSNPGGWSPVIGATLYGELNEETRDDNDYADSGAGTTGYFEVGLSAVTDPAVGTGHVLRYAVGRSNGAKSGTIEVSLYDGTTLIAGPYQHVDPAAGFTSFQQTLSEAQANNISSAGYAGALKVRVDSTVCQNPGHNQCSWIELEVPAASTTEYGTPDDGIKWGDLSEVDATFPKSATDGIYWGDEVGADLVIPKDITDGIKWGDDLSPAVIGSSLYDGIKIGENIDTVTYEQFGGDGIKWGDLSTGGLVADGSTSDGIKWGDTSEADLIILAEASDGIKWGDLGEEVVTLPAPLTDGVKWGEALESVGIYPDSNSDGIKWGDLSESASTQPDFILDGIKWGDSNDGILVIPVSISDGIKWTDLAEEIVTLVGPVTDGIWWGDEVWVQNFSYGLATDGIKWGDESVGDSAAAESGSCEDGIKWGDQSVGNAEIEVSASDGIKWGDLSSAETGFFGTATDGWLFGDSVSEDAAHVVSLSDGIKWGDWGERILGWDQIFASDYDIYGGGGIPGGYREYLVDGGRVFSITLYRTATGSGNEIRPAIYTKSIDVITGADLLKDFGIVTNTLSGWQVILDTDLSVIPASKYIFVVFKTDLGTTNTKYETWVDSQFLVIRTTEASSRSDSWDDPAAAQYSSEPGRMSVYLTILTTGARAVVQTSSSTSDGIKWGDEAVGNEIEVESGTCQDGILWGENIDTVTYESFSGDGIKWGDSVSSFIGQWASIVDGWIWGENFDLVTVTQFPDEGTIWGDSVFVGTGAAVDLTDGWKLGDTAAPFIGIFDSVDDGIKWGDSPEGYTTSWKYCQDGVKWGDSNIGESTRIAISYDKIIWGDEIFGETQTGGGDTYYGNPSDGMKWGDSASSVQEKIDSISDGWKIGDIISLNQYLGRTLSDGIRWGEAVAGSKASVFVDSLSDGWIWGDDTFYIDLEYLFSMDAYIVYMLDMRSEIEHREVIGSVEIEHMLSMKPRIQK